MDASGDDRTVAFEDLDIAIAHWHVHAWGGAEYLVTKLAETVDVDRVFTLGKPDPDDANPYGNVIFEDVTPHLDYPAVRRIQRRAGRVFEYAQWEDVDWRKLDNPDVLVTSGATTRAVITPENTLHANYCHSPPRWFYDLYHDRKGSLAGVLSRPLVRYLRTRDAALDARVDHYFANSPIIERRLWKYYKRDADVLYPPVDLNAYRNDGDRSYFLHLGRLDEEKGVPAVVDAFAGLDEQLVMAGGRGDITEDVMLRIRRTDNIDYRGLVSEEVKINLLAGCTALVFNGRNEDFGIVPIEANASGKPVLARDDGFPGIYIREGENGILHNGSIGGIRGAVKSLHSWTEGSMSVDRFSETAFRDHLRSSLAEVYRSTIEVDE